MERKTITIGNKHYKHYLENYYVTNDGTLARILLNENEDVVYFKPLKPFRSTFGHLRVEIKIKTNPAMANGIKMWAAGKTNPLGSKSLDFRYLR